MVFTKICRISFTVCPETFTIYHFTFTTFEFQLVLLSFRLVLSSFQLVTRVLPYHFSVNKFITNFKEKAELFNTFFAILFNTFFANQCTLLSNNSVLPNNLAKLTNKSLDAVNFSNDIYKIINNLEPNKAQGHDVLSIRMTELCENSICKQLSINLSYCLKEGKFLSDWKKAHLVAVHKKGV